MNKMISIASLFLLSSAYAALPLPSYIKPCARNDPNINECSKKSAQAAVPFIVKGDGKYHLPPFDPLEVPFIETQTGGENTPTRMNIQMSNVKIVGLKDANIEEIRHDLDKKYAYWRIKTPKAFATGQYNISGQILVVPIRGAGDFNITINDLMLSLEAPFRLEKGEDGLDYVRIDDSKLLYDLTRFYIHLDNLFDGNKELGNEINVFLNENWRESADAIGPILAESFNIIFRNIIQELTKLVPYDTIFPLSV